MGDVPHTLPPGTFVYDAGTPWDQLRSGSTTVTASGEPGVWFAGRTKEELKAAPIVEPLAGLGDRIRPHLLMYALHGPRDDGLQPLRDIYMAALRLLRAAAGRTLLLDELQTALAAEPGAETAAIDDTLKMMGTMGVISITSRKGEMQVAFSDLLERGHRRRDYLATFTNELMAKSRRIDLLIGHAGTVGSYREELLRGLLTQLLPRRYEAISGFIEGCPRQLDIIVWDAENYAPLFREQGFVVVPLASVRAVVEVKTTLSDGPLRKALEILWDTFRTRQTTVPVFKGIFAFEPGLDSSHKVANAMRSFYNSVDDDGLIHREHGYPWAGANAVCVPGHHLVRERYSTTDGTSFPQPRLTSVEDAAGDDAYSALFLGILLAHLDLDEAPKRQNGEMFEPVLRMLEDRDLGTIYDDWRPTRATSEIAATLEPEGANTYVERVHRFRAGTLSFRDVAEGLAAEPRPGEDASAGAATAPNQTPS